MSEEDTVRAPDQVDGEMQGDALIHEAPAAEAPAEGAEGATELPAEPEVAAPAEVVAEEKAEGEVNG